MPPVFAEEHVHSMIERWSRNVQTFIDIVHLLLQKIDGGFYVPAGVSSHKASLVVCGILNDLYKYKKHILRRHNISDLEALFDELRVHVYFFKKLLVSQFSNINEFDIAENKQIKWPADLAKGDNAKNLTSELEDLKNTVDRCGVTYVNTATRALEEAAVRIDDYTHLSSWYAYAFFTMPAWIALRQILPDRLKELLSNKLYGGYLPKWSFGASWLGLPEISIKRPARRAFAGLGIIEDYYERLVRVYVFFKLLRYVLDDKYKYVMDAIPETLYEQVRAGWRMLKGVPTGCASGWCSPIFDGVDFDDEYVLGFDQQKQSIEDVMAYVLNREEYAQRGYVVPKGIMLIGPSGSGKTLFVRALIGTINKQFRLHEKRVGVKLFELTPNDLCRLNAPEAFEEMLKKIRTQTPCILFLNNLQAFTCNGMQNSGFYNALAAFLDTLNESIKQADRIFVIGATTDSSVIPGELYSYKRFGKLIYFTLPTAEQRRQFFERTLALHFVAEDERFDSVDIDTYVKQTVGCGYGQLEAIFSAARFASHNTGLRREHIQRAIDRQVHGFIDGEKLPDDQVQAIIAHQAGHAFLAYALHPRSALELVTVRAFRRPPGLADAIKTDPEYGAEYGALMRYDPHESNARISADELEKNIQILLAGACAEDLLLHTHLRNHHTQDRREALELIKTLLSDGAARPGTEKRNRAYDRLERRACDILEKNKRAVRVIADALKQKSTMSAFEIGNITRAAECRP